MITFPSFLAAASSHRLTTEAQGPQGFDDHVEENHYDDDDMNIVVYDQNCDDDDMNIVVYDKNCDDNCHSSN